MANIFVRFGKYAVTAISTESKKGGRLLLKLWVHLLRIALSVGGGLLLWLVIPTLLEVFLGVEVYELMPQQTEEAAEITLGNLLLALGIMFSITLHVWLVYCWLMGPIKWLREKLGIDEENLKLKHFTNMLDGLN